MEFFPQFILKRNRFRGTPHWSIAFAIGIPVAVLLLVNGKIDILGDMYAFGLLGAFTVICLGLDIIRYRERRKAVPAFRSTDEHNGHGHEAAAPSSSVFSDALVSSNHRFPLPFLNGQTSPAERVPKGILPAAASSLSGSILKLWRRLDFWLGLLTTLLVMLAWVISIVSQPLATAFGGSVAFAGMAVALIIHARHRQQGHSPVLPTGVEGRLPDSILAVLVDGSDRNEAIIRSAISNARNKPVVFLYVGELQAARVPRQFEIVDPYLEDQQAKETFGRAEYLARQAGIARRFVYRQQEPEAVVRLWREVHPRDLVVAAEKAAQLDEVSPDRIRYELTSRGKVAHLLKHW